VMGTSARENIRLQQIKTQIQQIFSQTPKKCYYCWVLSTKNT